MYVLQVIALEVDECEPASVVVWDLDTRLTFPCSLQLYVQHALQASSIVLPPKLARCVGHGTVTFLILCYAGPVMVDAT